MRATSSRALEAELRKICDQLVQELELLGTDRPAEATRIRARIGEVRRQLGELGCALGASSEEPDEQPLAPEST
jgi:hypothetical protein